MTKIPEKLTMPGFSETVKIIVMAKKPVKSKAKKPAAKKPAAKKAASKKK